MFRSVQLFSFLLFFSILSTLTNAQLTGIKNIPGDYATISEALTVLNSSGVGTGGVTFNIASGYTETITGTLVLTASGTAANPIIFQKNGAGVNPVITAFTGTNLSNNAVHDDIWQLVGSDYVTIDGIDLFDPNTTSPAAMEGGYVLYKASLSDGAKYNTIKNCNITLTRNNVTSGSGPSVEGSRAIEVTNSIPSAATTALVPLTSAGSNSFNLFYSNTIQNCNYGIVLSGYIAPFPYTSGDNGNDIGGSSLSTANTIINFGGGTSASVSSAGVYVSNQWGVNISFNTINNNNGSGVNHINALRGIYATSGTSASATINYNTITLKGGGTTSAVTAIENGIGSTSAGNIVNINNNTITGEYLTATSGVFYGINNSSTPTTLNIQNNTLSNIIYSNSAITGSGNVYLIYNQNPAVNVNVLSNTIRNFTRYGTVGGSSGGIIISNGTNQKVKNNTIDTININGSGSGSLLYSIQVSAGAVEADSNTISNLTISKVTGTGNFYGIFNTAASTSESYKYNRIFNLTTTGTGSTAGMYLNSTSSSRIVSNNFIYNINSAGLAVTGINLINSPSIVSNNKIGKISSTHIGSPVVSGLLLGNLTANGTATVYNNIIGEIESPNAAAAAASAPSVRGINITGSTLSDYYLYYNTVYLNASSVGAVFSSAGLYATSSATSTTANLVLKNNLIMNNSTPSGAGLAVAYQRSTTSRNNYDASSNYNLFYAGIPDAAHLIFYDGSASINALSDYKVLVSPRESVSKTENPVFSSTTFTDPDYLNINISTPTQIESGGIAINGFNTDFNGNIRNASFTDIGAYEFNGIASDITPPEISYSLLTNYIVSPTRIVSGISISDFNGINTSSGTRPRIYYKKSTHTNTINDNTNATDGWKWVEASGTTSPFGFTFDFTKLFGGSVSIGDTIQYFVVAQDMAATPNVQIASGAFASTPVSVNLTSAAMPIGGIINSYTIKTTMPSVVYIGAGGVPLYTSLSGAGGLFSVMNSSVPVGNITAIVGGNTVEDGTVSLLPFSDDYTLTIKPSDNTIRKLEGTAVAASAPMILLDGADNVVFDGRDPVSGTGNYLRFINNSAAAANTGNVFKLQNDARKCTIRNSIIESNATSLVNASIQIASTNFSYGSDSLTVYSNIFKASAGTNPGSYFTAINNSSTLSGNYRNGNMTIRQNTFSQFLGTSTGVLTFASGTGDSVSVDSNFIFNDAVQTQTISFINFIATTSGYNTFNYNSIGGSAADRSGTPITSNLGITMIGIKVNAAPTGITEIKGNKFSNVIGTLSGSITSSVVKGIEGLGRLDISNNVIGGGASVWDTVRTGYDNGWIEITGTASDTINVFNNLISNTSYWRKRNDRNCGIQIGGGLKVNVYNNIIRNMKSNSTGNSASFQLFGIRTANITANSITNIYGNQIYSLQHYCDTVLSSHTSHTPIGINYANGSATGELNIYNNKIWDITSSASTASDTGTTSPSIIGISIGANSSKLLIYNNSISLATQTGTPARVYGIYMTIGSSVFPTCIYDNSIYIGGIQTGSSINTYSFAFYRTATTPIVLKNNIFIYNRTGGAGGSPIYTSNLTNWVDTSSNHNLFVGLNSSSIAAFNTFTGSDFASWKVASLGDVNSLASDIASIVPANLWVTPLTADMTLQSNQPVVWYASGQGTPVTYPAVSTDINGNLRSTSIAGGPVSIGSSEVNNPSAVPVPIDQTITGLGTYNFNMGGKQIASITINAPTSGFDFVLSLRHFPGITPPFPGAGTEYAKRFDSIYVSSGSPVNLNYDLKLYSYDNQRFNIVTPANMKITQSTNGGLTYTMLSGSYTQNNPSYVTSTGLSSLSIFALTSSDNPLPIELSSFTASEKERVIMFNWVTKTEVNTSKFILQKSINSGKDWTSAGEIKAAGNSNTERTYTLTDKAATSGSYSYRLKIIDNDGLFTYSESIEIQIGVPKEYSISQNYPNPFNPATKIDYQLPFDSRVTLEIFSITGERVMQLVNEEQKAGYYSRELNLGNLASGVYIYRIIAVSTSNPSNFTNVKKMIMLK